LVKGDLLAGIVKAETTVLGIWLATPFAQDSASLHFAGPLTAADDVRGLSGGSDSDELRREGAMLLESVSHPIQAQLSSPYSAVEYLLSS